jgi:hypothetical protein
LTLVETRASNAPHELRSVGFFDRDQQLLPALIAALERSADPDARPLVEAILARIDASLLDTTTLPPEPFKRSNSPPRNGGHRRTSPLHQRSRSCNPAGRVSHEPTSAASSPTSTERPRTARVQRGD